MRVPNGVNIATTRNYGETAKAKSDELLEHLLPAPVSYGHYIGLCGSFFAMSIRAANGDRKSEVLHPFSGPLRHVHNSTLTASLRLSREAWLASGTRRQPLQSACNPEM